MSNFPAVFNLNNLNGVNGFALNGINANDRSGISVSGAGDVNGDGIADSIIGAPGANNAAGQSYVIFGSRNAFPDKFNLAGLNGTNGFVLNGINRSDGSGASVSGAGDFNGDGIADVIIGARSALNLAGQSYVVFGSRSAFPATFSLANLNGANGFALNGINANDNSGRSVSGVGDFNGDGIADVIIGAVDGFAQGKAYVVFGSRNTFPPTFSLANLNGANGFVLNPLVGGGTGTGWSVSGAGDINGDGIADAIIGAYNTLSASGSSYVVFGSRSAFPATFSLANLNGANGFVLNGINVNDNSGWSVSGAGDVNSDGIADVIIGARNALNKAGQSYVVFGSRNAFPATFSLANLNGANGFALNGINAGNRSGSSVSGAGDFNGDGIADVIIGAYNALSVAGQSYVVLGSRSAFPATFSLANLNGANGFALNGINANDISGFSVSGAGDFNSDGIADIIIGAYGANNNAGQSYVVFNVNEGSTPSPSVTITNTPTKSLSSTQTSTNSISFSVTITTTPTPSLSSAQTSTDSISFTQTSTPSLSSAQTSTDSISFTQTSTPSLSSAQTSTDSISFTQSTTLSNLVSSTQMPTKSLGSTQTSTDSINFTQSTMLTNSISSTQTPTSSPSVTITQTPTESPSSTITPTSTFQQSSGINSASTQAGENINVGAIISGVIGVVLGAGLVVGVGAYAVSKGWCGGSKKPLGSTAVAWGGTIAINALNPIHAMAQPIFNDPDNSNYDDDTTDKGHSSNYGDDIRDVGCVGCVDTDILSCITPSN